MPASELALSISRTTPHTIFPPSGSSWPKRSARFGQADFHPDLQRLNFKNECFFVACGLLELSLSRSGVLDTPQNRRIFADVSNAVGELIVEHIKASTKDSRIRNVPSSLQPSFLNIGSNGLPAAAGFQEATHSLRPTMKPARS